MVQVKEDSLALPAEVAKVVDAVIAKQGIKSPR